MKKIRCHKLLIYVFAFGLCLQLLTGCSLFARPSQKLFLSSNYTFDVTPKQSLIHQKFLDNIAPNKCPQWFYENYNDIVYNQETVETIQGTVLSVDLLDNDIKIQVETEKETISVYLAPVWYLENRDIEINSNDTVEIKGSRVNFNGENAIIASEITTGDTTFKLRDENGFSLWGDKNKPEEDWILDMFPYLCDAE